jgi:lysophospholipase L1-like esterase
MAGSKTALFKCLTLLFSFFVVIAFEILLRLVMPSLADDSDRLRILTSQDVDRRSSVLKIPDPTLLWKLKPGSHLINSEFLNQHGFRGPDFSVTNNRKITRIVCMGDSRTFGFGVTNEHETFCGRLRQYIRNCGLESRFEIINLGVIGYTSYQGKQLLDKYVLSLNPDYLVCWFGFNDTLFFHLTDREAARQLPHLRKIRARLNRVSLFLLLRKGYQNITRRSGEAIQVGQRIVRRVPLEDYKNNLYDIAVETQRQQIKLILLTTPVRPEIPLVLNAKLIQGSLENGTPIERLQCQYTLENKWLMDARSFPGSERELDQFLDKYPELPILHYFKSLLLKKKKAFREANKHLETAKALDTEREVVANYNQIVHSISESFDHVTPIELVSLFESKSSQTLFLDDCHPNAQGHELIADCLIPAVFNKDM